MENGDCKVKAVFASVPLAVTIEAIIQLKGVVLNTGSELVGRLKIGEWRLEIEDWRLKIGD
ncbi:MAG: hypothetical protein DRH79_02695 [Candidatus Cloacimonadota bacterium]|nr:MAG: hypothetical protein DRH79_02695 [Candidatus Cloacimonadota bacterium]